MAVQLKDSASRIYAKQHVASLSSCHLQSAGAKYEIIFKTSFLSLISPVKKKNEMNLNFYDY